MKDKCSVNIFTWNPKYKDVIIDTIIYSALFYALSQSDMYPKSISSNTEIQALLFGICYIIIQKLTKRL
jgi:hypothetical protein